MLSRMLGQGTNRLFAVQALAAAILLFAVSCRHADGPYPSKELKLIWSFGPH